jgi:hypothetical protein
MATVTGTLTGTGAGSTVVGTAADISVSGISSSTVQIQRRIGGNWLTIEALTADGERVVENATGLEMRVNCSVYGSGTIAYALVTR